MKKIKFDDKLIREALVFCINHSKNKNNDGLKNYILNEMTKEELISIYWTGKVLTEDSTSDKISKVAAWSAFPLYILAGGKTTQAIEKFLTGKIKDESRKHDAAAFLVTLGTLWGASILAKSIYYLYKKSKDQCTINCRRIVRPGKDYQAKVAICYHQCKIQFLQKMINRLRNDRNMCGTTKYPEKCIQNLNSQIVTYQQELEKEVIRLKKSKEILFSRLRKIPAAMSSKPSTEKIR